ncbi:unnamed protein product [Penicillium salamii]|nr:unnamed protein product [Penicillium salamii]
MSFQWPYQFVTLSEEDKVQRRALLDLRGQYAQWSIIFAILIVKTMKTSTTFSSGNRPKRSSSIWDRPLFPGWAETRGQYLACGLWLSWLVALSVWNSGNDYLHLTKAIGQVGLSQLPLQVLMSPMAYISSKPTTSSVLSIVTGISQQTLTPYHRLFGRVVISPLLLAHAALYTLFFVQSSHPEFGTLLAKRVQDLDVQCGMAAILTVVLLFLFARPRGTAQRGLQSWLMQGSLQERRRMFYFGHVSLVIFLCVVAYTHVQQAQRFIIQSLGASLLNGVCSWVILKFVEV